MNDSSQCDQGAMAFILFRFAEDADCFFATIGNSNFLGSRVVVTYQDPMLGPAGASKVMVIKRLPLALKSVSFYHYVRQYGKVVSCKVMIDRSGVETFCLLQFENQANADRCFIELGSLGNFQGQAM